ncbi:ArsR family transcriptional regulator [Actinomadura sp. KC06]|uniref:ArsR family transcriptional regulator n=1 Tax=Actinomadura sp. KC06 TaxID=2530369 RepID=UPI00104BBEA4|nr:ArsR family transcriptional regulator [Actinomadura sp. KC06]TDD35263.1 ArsR family transcriptional regulator [Actinomadura sp. KC06]
MSHPLDFVPGFESVRPGTPSDIPGQLLGETRALFRRWLGNDYDTGALDAVLATAAAERLQGDPCWLLVVSGSGAAKTETVMPLQGAGAVIVSTISGEAALLSGTSEKERSKDATGGLLRKVGPRGLLVIKDVTSIISMHRDTRASVMAALREVYDGRWDRDIGADGGKTLTWKGRLVVIGAVTTAWDSAHSVISAMGDRFVLVRVDSAESRGRRAAGLQALRNTGHEVTMREQLSGCVGRLLDAVERDTDVDLSEMEMLALLDLADIVTLARTAVERDYAGNVVQAHAPEAPTRFTKQLGQIVRGGVALGMGRAEALGVAVRCAGDSMPPLRLRVLVDVAAHSDTPTKDVVKRLQLPRKTVDRVLQELHLLGLLTVDEIEYGQDRVRWIYSLADSISRPAVEKLARNVTPPARNGDGS